MKRQVYDPAMQLIAPGADALTAAAVHRQMCAKGFWDDTLRQFTYHESRTLEQLLHVLNEWGEGETALESDATLVESADVVIVILDLLGAHDVTVAFNDCWPYEVLNELTVPRLLAMVADTYRKERNLDVNRLKLIIGYLRYRFGSVALSQAVATKLATNANRPSLYGLHQSTKE